MEDLREMRGFFIMIRVCIHPSYMPTGLQKDSPKVFADFNDDEVMEVRSFSGEDLFLLKKFLILLSLFHFLSSFSFSHLPTQVFLGLPPLEKADAAASLGYLLGNLSL